ncbi:response regulator transcription factor [Sporolactobacillus pectinivorans]|uniref:response regulator transcription factor n=1 Tax=Sporolactobacillus pectinivorans TaxID=1591408 RepID=UPI000C269273|nr:response regulator transcription factor [Sporolactobacillus pectinivorans]
MKKILIVEDDPQIAMIERDYLAVNDFEVKIAQTGDEGIQEALAEQYNLILLDLMLPGTDGFSVCRTLRETLDIPIIIVTAKQEDIDMIKGLGLGADDYITKPFSPNVLIAHVKANLSQYERLKKTGHRNMSEIRAGDICIQTGSRRVFVQEREIEVKNKEYELLLFLVTNIDMVFSKETLYERIWGFNALGDNATVAVHINRLREKIEHDPANPKYIQTVWGAGYRFKV